MLFNAVGATCSTEDIPWLENYMSEKLVDLSQYKDYLPNIFENEEYAGMIAYRTEKLSNGTGGLYAIPAKYGNNTGCNLLAGIRYDLWKILSRGRRRHLAVCCP